MLVLIWQQRKKQEGETGRKNNKIERAAPVHVVLEKLSYPEDMSVLYGSTCLTRYYEDRRGILKLWSIIGTFGVYPGQNISLFSVALLYSPFVDKYKQYTHK